MVTSFLQQRQPPILPCLQIISEEDLNGEKESTSVSKRGNSEKKENGEVKDQSKKDEIYDHHKQNGETLSNQKGGETERKNELTEAERDLVTEIEQEREKGDDNVPLLEEHCRNENGREEYDDEEIIVDEEEEEEEEEEEDYEPDSENEGETRNGKVERDEDKNEKERPRQMYIVEGHNCYYFQEVEKMRGWGEKSSESIGSLLLSFFRFFALEFDYENSVVSVRLGRNLTKEEKDWDIPSPSPPIPMSPSSTLFPLPLSNSPSSVFLSSSAPLPSTPPFSSPPSASPLTSISFMDTSMKFHSYKKGKREAVERSKKVERREPESSTTKQMNVNTDSHVHFPPLPQLRKQSSLSTSPPTTQLTRPSQPAQPAQIVPPTQHTYSTRQVQSSQPANQAHQLAQSFSAPNTSSLSASLQSTHLASTSSPFPSNINAKRNPQHPPLHPPRMHTFPNSHSNSYNIYAPPFSLPAHIQSQLLQANTQLSYNSGHINPSFPQGFSQHHLPHLQLNHNLNVQPVPHSVNQHTTSSTFTPQNQQNQQDTATAQETSILAENANASKSKQIISPTLDTAPQPSRKKFGGNRPAGQGIPVNTKRPTSLTTLSTPERRRKGFYNLAIEDPFETTHNLGRVVDSDSLNIIRYEFLRAYHLLSRSRGPSLLYISRKYHPNEDADV
eukprot:TRINITY_DN3359_c0_g1_i1.p1 TRINITY_DN3359_c0_g1~~TRINITY_DN3359_c0_g1_i1.p1  ORF type:complete len:671 (-),score=143.03 TRINITY_DN3359_c0_g1_i1:30-2042(-)